MKTRKVLIAATFLGLAMLPLKAQVWFDGGVKGGVGPTLMLNKNISDDRNYDHEFTAGFTYGAKLGVYFGYHNGITVDYMRGISKQNFEYNINGTIGQNNFEWIHNDILLMFRHSGDGAYVEIGPKYSFVQEVTQITTGNSEVDVSNLFEDSYPSAVFGFGSYLAGSDLFSIQMGFRLHYAFSDMVSDEGRENNVPAGIAYDEYKETRPFAAQFMLEVNYAFGRFARTSCAHRWKLILFE